MSDQSNIPHAKFCTTKHYKKNKLKKRIARVMRLSNTVSMVLFLIALIMVVGSLTAVMGFGFSHYTASNIAKDAQYLYQSLDNKDDFKMFLISETEIANTIMASLPKDMPGINEIRNQQKMDADLEFFSNITYFEYRITFKDQVVYDSLKESRQETMMNQYSDNNMMIKKVFTEASAPYFNEDGQVMGKVMVRVSPDIINMVISAAIGLVLFLFITNAIISKLLTLVTSQWVARPLEVLATQMENMANEDLEEAFNTVLDVKNPVSEISSLTRSTTRIMQKMSDYYQTMMAQNQELEAQRDTLDFQREELEAQRDELESQNEQLLETSGTLHSMNNAYLSRTLKLQNLLDNVGQGFMSFGSDLLVNSEYSIACTDMVYPFDHDHTHSPDDNHHHDIQGLNVTDLLFDDPDQRDFIGSLLTKIIEGSSHERNLFMPLLPEELTINGRHQSIEYKLVLNEKNHEHMMVILTDITHTKALEEQMQLERDVLQMIVKVLLNRDDFISHLEDFKTLVATGFEHVTQDEYDDTLRALHTAKGTFAQYYMNKITHALNDLEDHLYKSDSLQAMKDINQAQLLNALEDDLAVITAYVGPHFLENADLYTINESKILEIEQKIKSLLPASEYKTVLPIIQSIRYRSVKEGLKAYPDYVAKLSERLDKSILPFEIEGDDVYVDFNTYQNVFKAMVHLFRNAVDHGIEDMDTRLLSGKSEIGCISCQVKSKPGGFSIIITDDGQGISLENQEKIFTHGFSTKDSATAISGRGVGLTALKSTLDALGGTISIDSKEGQGTTFTLDLPLLTGTDIVAFEPKNLVDRIEETASHYFKTLGFDFKEATTEANHQITLFSVSALLNMKGSVDGLLIVSANEALAFDLVKAFMMKDLAQEDLMTYAEDVLGEVTNTILGNVLGRLEEEGIYLSIGIPVMLSNKGAYIKYTEHQILSAHYQSGDHKITLSLLITEGQSGITHKHLLEEPLDH